MLQANELRIGNWVKDGKQGEYYHQIGFTDILDLETGWAGTYLYKPIELTPEILEKAGFVKREGSQVWKMEIKYQDENYPCSLQVTGDGIQICRSGIGAITAPVKHLHSLQNLYFALTGTELNINL